MAGCRGTATTRSGPGVVGGERPVDPAELGELRRQVARGALQVRHRLGRRPDAEHRRGLGHQLTETARAFRRQRRGLKRNSWSISATNSRTKSSSPRPAPRSPDPAVDLGDAFGHRPVDRAVDVPGGLADRSIRNLTENVFIIIDIIDARVSGERSTIPCRRGGSGASAERSSPSAHARLIAVGRVACSSASASWSARVRGVGAHGKRDAICGGSADPRRAAHPHFADCPRRLAGTGENGDLEAMRQPTLVSDAHPAAFHPNRTISLAFHLHASPPPGLTQPRIWAGPGQGVRIPGSKPCDMLAHNPG